MGRVIGAVIGGYVVSLFCVMMFTGVAWLAFGADRAFLPGSYDASMLWIAVSLALSLVAAILGGWAGALIARGDARATRGLVALTLVLGALFAIPVLRGTRDHPPPRGGITTMQDLARYVRQPVWVALALPLLGAAGVLLGAGMRKRGAVV